MTKLQLVEMARDGLSHAAAGTIAQAEDIYRVPTSQSAGTSPREQKNPDKNQTRNRTMPTPEEIRATIVSYVEMMCASDIEGIMGLYADDATAEDPVGGEVQQGIEALRNFYSLTAPMLQVELAGPICVSGNECAFPLQAELTMGDTRSYLDATDVFAFNDDGQITSMRAYWNPAEMRPER